MADIKECALCKNPKATSEREATRDVHIIDCVTCGRYKITGSFSAIIEGLPQEDRDNLHLLSGWTRTQHELFNNVQTLTTDNYRTIINNASKTVLEKRNLLISYIARKSKHPGDKLHFRVHQSYTVAFCKNEGEFAYFLKELEKTNIINPLPQTMGRLVQGIILTTHGWDEYYHLTKTGLDSNQVFLAMNFNADMEQIYKKGFKQAIENARYNCYRVDKEEHNEKICEEIIHQINKSKFLVADVTGQRGGVYFEAGYANGIDMQVIWTCNEKEKDQVHFDTRQYNHIFWNDEEDLKEKLENRILGTIGRGKNKVDGS